MIRIVHAPTIEEPETLVVLSAKLRLYAGLSHGGSYYHLVRPLRAFEDAQAMPARLRVAPETELERAAARG